MRISDWSSDVCSSDLALSERPVSADAVAFGEVSLSGEVRPVAHGALRLKEAGKLGFERALVPAGMAGEKSGLRLSGFKTLGALVDHMLGRGDRKSTRLNSSH